MNFELPQVRSFPRPHGFDLRRTVLSAIWNKISIFDPTNGPESGSSCLLLNSRYLLMFGGCYPEQNPYRPCMSYSYDSLLYNVTKPDWEDYTYHKID